MHPTWVTRFRSTLLLGVALLAATARRTPAENLLANPSFEIAGQRGVPASWSREYEPDLSGPFEANGAAVCLMTEEWVFGRPQFITQEAKLPGGAKALRLAAWCKGQGLIRMAIQLRKGGKPLETKTLAPSTIAPGKYVLPVETEKVFGLGPEYGECEAFATVGDDAESALVRLGNTIGDRNTTNIWGKAWIDQVSLTVVDAVKPAPAGPSHEVVKKLRPPRVYRDVAPYAHIVTNPPSLNPRDLIDGDEETPIKFFPGSERYASIALLYPAAIPIDRVFVHLRGNVGTFTLCGDTNGDGQFDKLLARVEGLAEVKEWVAIETPTTQVHALRIRAIEGPGLHGYHRTNSFLDEIKIYTETKAIAPHLRALTKAAPFKRVARRKPGVPMASLSPIAFSLPDGDVKRLGKMMCADLWMWGANALRKDVKVQDYRQTEAFRRTTDFCKQMGVDTIYLDLHVNCGRNIVPWPSKVANGTNENVFEALIDALHAEGFKVYVELLSHLSPPFERAYWHYPKEETSRYAAMQQFPSIIHGAHHRDNWLQILDEIMACGADGVALCTDEHYYKGHFMETFPKDDPARKLYRERFGHDLPTNEGDTLAFRQWITMRHEGICGLYGYWAKQLRKKYPDIYLGSNFMQCYANCSYLIETGIPMDLLGAVGGLTELGSDYMDSYGVRMMSAANGWRRGTMWFNGNLWGPIVGGEKRPDMDFYGDVMRAAMYGLSSLSFWRFNYVVENGNAPAVTRAYSMLSDLEALGLWDAKPPKQIALLTSRTSLDWWQIRAWWGQHENPNWDRAVEGMRGWFAERAAVNILQENGLPFDWLFLDNPRHLEQIEGHSVLVIPFPWSVSQPAAERVKAAAERGARVILLDGRPGHTDEWGETHETPAFTDLVESGQATLLDDDILTWAATDVFTDKVLKLIHDALGDARPLTLERYGERIEATVLHKSPKEAFVFLLNWEKTRMTVIDLGLSLPEGRYEVFARDENRWHQVTLNSQALLTHDQLQDFRLTMGPQQPYVLYVREAR